MDVNEVFGALAIGRERVCCCCWTQSWVCAEGLGRLALAG